MAAERLAVNIDGAAELVGCSARHLRALLAQGRFPRGVRLGRRVVWPVAELEAWLAAGAPRVEVWEELKRGGTR